MSETTSTCIGIYHKLGYRGAPITQLAFGDNDDCRGWLVGEPHKGLRYMFQMMNEARVDVGMGAAAIASAAYYASLEYARQRPQGRPVAGKDPLAPQVPIIEHADVKRMLLFQRAVVEGSLALIFQCAQYVDLARVTEGEEKERYELLLDLLTPVAKSYPSEMGILSVSQGLQCLGGYGYCDEFPLEQYYRDVRIHPIHEGTTGIQGMDLLGRKVVMKNGKALFLYLAELEKAIAAGRAIPDCAPCGGSSRSGRGDAQGGDRLAHGPRDEGRNRAVPCRRHALPGALRNRRDRLAVAPPGRHGGEGPCCEPPRQTPISTGGRSTPAVTSSPTSCRRSMASPPV